MNKSLEDAENSIDPELLWVRHEYSSYKLSAALLQRNNVWDNLELIKSLHHSRLDILLEMFMITLPTKKYATMRELAYRATEIEYKLQDAWGFDRDSSKHYWNSVPKCCCFQIVDESCIVHGFTGLGYLITDEPEPI